MSAYKPNKKKLAEIKADAEEELGAAYITPQKYGLWVMWLIEELEQAYAHIEATDKKTVASRNT